jgi:hypothetical protein
VGAREDPVRGFRMMAHDRPLTRRLTGRCKLVIIDGNDNTLTIAAAASIAVNGNQNVVSVERADRIYTPGDDNRVAYKRSIDPKTRARGRGNLRA